MALKFFWRCEGTALDGTHDYSTGGTNMTLVGEASLSTDAAYLGTNGVACVDSIDFYHMAVDSIIGSTIPVGSIGFWFRFPDVVFSGGNPFGVTFEEPTWNVTNNWLGIRTSGTTVQLSMRSNAVSALSLDCSDIGLSTATWYFVTAAWDFANDKRKIAAYSASAQLGSAEDTSTGIGSRQPVTITRFDIGNRSGTNQAFHVDNVFVGDSYDDAEVFATYRNITSYTQYGVAGASLKAKLYANGAFQTGEFVELSSGIPGMRICQNNTVQTLGMQEIALARGKYYANGTFACAQFIEE